MWEPAAATPEGIYTYRIRAAHDEEGGCDDQDKSRWLTVDVENFYWFEKDAENGKLRGVVRYGLNRAAAQVQIKFYDHELNEVGQVACPELSAGEHFSDVYDITVPYDQNGNLIQPVYCVAFADECDADANENRNRQPKPALPRGTASLDNVCPMPTPSQGKVLISAKHGGGYPLAEQTVDREIEITFDYGPKFAGCSVCFAPFDPPDQSPYNDSDTWGDNVGGSGSVNPTTAVLDGNGRASTVLTITDRCAGDNYCVASCPFVAPTEGMARALFAAGHNLVAWKRIYVEEAQMYRQGADLAQSAAQGQTTLVLQQALGGVGPGAMLHLFGADNRDGEQVEVETVNGATVELTASIAHTYSTASGAAVGVPNGGFYTANRELLAGNAYGAAFDGVDGGTFVEFLRQPQARSVVPLRPHFTSYDDMHDYCRQWFVNTNQTNYVWLVGAKYDLAEPGQAYGMAHAGLNWCYVFVEQIGAAQINNSDTTNHEIGHQFVLLDHDTNFPDPANGVRNHEDTDCCLMSYVRNRGDSVCEFCPGCLSDVRSEEDNL